VTRSWTGGQARTPSCREAGRPASSASPDISAAASDAPLRPARGRRPLVGSASRGGRRVVPSTGVLREVFDRRLRWCAATLCLCGTGLAAVSVVPAFRRLGTGPAVVFVVVAVAFVAFAMAVLRAWRWALALCAAALGGQALALTGTVAELVAGVDAAKARQVRMPPSGRPCSR